MKTTTLFNAFAVALLSSLVAAQQRPTTLAGCLGGDPGNFTLGAVPSGDVYRLQGNTGMLDAHRRQLVRLRGTETASASSTQVGAFNVQNLEVLADTCTAPLPPQRLNEVQSITGESGAGQTAVADTTTSSVGEVTPGFQTEAGEAQAPGTHSEAKPGERNQAPRRGELAPPQWGQVGESQQSGDRSAAAAERAEEQPSHTLGVNAQPSYSKQSAPATQAGSGIAGNTSTPPSTSGMSTQNPTAGTTKEVGKPPANAGQSASSDKQNASSAPAKGEHKKDTRHHARRKRRAPSDTESQSSTGGNAQSGAQTNPPGNPPPQH